MDKDAPHLYERVAEIAALPGSYLQRDFGLEPDARFVRLVERVRDGRDAGLFSRTDMSARMRNQKWHAQRLASLQLVDEALDRALAQFVVRRTEIEQVRVVREDHPDPGLGLRGFERLDFLARVRLGGPLTRALGENLDAVAADLPAARQRLADAPRDRYVRSNQRPGLIIRCHYSVQPGVSLSPYPRSYPKRSGKRGLPARDRHKYSADTDCCAA